MVGHDKEKKRTLEDLTRDSSDELKGIPIVGTGTVFVEGNYQALSDPSPRFSVT